MTVYGESVESISFFIHYIGLHNTHFHSDYNCNKGVMHNVTKITSQLDRCTLLHKYATPS